MAKNYNYDFKNLFVLDMANNHQGDLEHGLRIIDQHAEVVKKHGIKAGIKFQFRQLDTFIHPYHVNDDHKQIKRFNSTRIPREHFETMLKRIKEHGLISICTPFDEGSVDVIEEMGFDIIKVASCSAKDWPLIEKIAKAGMPVIYSTGGLTTAEIDSIVSFNNHHGVDHAIMHCVSIYPTLSNQCQLNQIEYLKNRYPNTTIGWSTHEEPGDDDPVKVAVAKGAEMLERHVGVEVGDIKLNAYSSTPAQLDHWITGYKKAVALCGAVTNRPVSPKEESEALNLLQRGVFAKRPIEKGETLTMDDVFFAIPYDPSMVASGEFKVGTVATKDIEEMAVLTKENVELPEQPKRLIIQHALHEIKAMLNEARIPLNFNFKVEYSHHYGIEKFHETGAVLIDLVNRSYCKKIIVQLPGQSHPSHFHKRKEETFYVLSGVLNLEVDGHKRTLYPGETILVQPGVWHSFSTETGVIFEELSTTHYNDDSYYRDKKINKMARSERKTVVDHWGRFQLKDAEQEVTSNNQ